MSTRRTPARSSARASGDTSAAMSTRRAHLPCPCCARSSATLAPRENPMSVRGAAASTSPGRSAATRAMLASTSEGADAYVHVAPPFPHATGARGQTSHSSRVAASASHAHVPSAVPHIPWSITVTGRAPAPLLGGYATRPGDAPAAPSTMGERSRASARAGFTRSSALAERASVAQATRNRQHTTTHARRTRRALSPHMIASHAPRRTRGAPARGSIAALPRLHWVVGGGERSVTAGRYLLMLLP